MLVTDLSAHPVEVDDLDADGFLVLAAEIDTKERGAARDKLRLAANWCVRHPATIDAGAATWADSGVPEALGCDETIGGEGTPLVAAFAAEPFAASIKTSTSVGMQLMADALNLIHRLPRTWAKVTSLDIPAWRGCRVVRLTVSLTKQAAAYVDEELAGRVGSCGVVTIDRIIAEAVARFDPAVLAEREAKAKRTWGVKLLYPLVMSTALVYYGEHYVIDIVAGAALAVVVHVGCKRWEDRRVTTPRSVSPTD